MAGHLNRTPSSLSVFDRFNRGESQTFTTGNVFFVGSAVSGNGDDGTTNGDQPERPFATLDYAIGQCTANQGDTIYVMPGHRETIGDTTLWTLDVNGVSILGLGTGFSRPEFQFDHANATNSWTASNCRVSGIIFEASIASVATSVTMAGTSQHNELDHCRWTFDATGVEFTAMVTLGSGGTDSADYVEIHHNWFEAENIDGCASALLIDDCQFLHIHNNLFTGDFNSVAIDGAAASSNCLDFVIYDNLIENRDASGLTVDLDDSATGIAARNMTFGSAAVASNTDWGGVKIIENYVTDAVDAHGILHPTTTAA